MRVAIISKGKWPQITGGAELVTEKVRQGLLKKGHQVFLISKNWQKTKKERPEMAMIIDENWARWAASRAVQFNPDIIYICQYGGENAALFIPKKIPIVLMAHDIVVFEQKLDPEIKNQMIKIWQQSIKKAKKVIVPGKEAKQKLLTLYPEAKNKVLYIPLGI